MWMIQNRHNETLARDGEFYPKNSVAGGGIRLFASENEAKIYALANIRDYNKVMPSS